MKKEYDLSKLKKRTGKTSSSPSATKVPVSLRLDGGDLAMLRTEAESAGIPYQTLISSILHQYVNGSLVPKKVLQYLKSDKVS